MYLLRGPPFGRYGPATENTVTKQKISTAKDKKCCLKIFGHRFKRQKIKKIEGKKESFESNLVYFIVFLGKPLKG